MLGLLFLCQHATASERNARQWELSTSAHSHSRSELPKRHALPLLYHCQVIPVSRLCARHLQLLLRRCLLNHCRVIPVTRLCARPLHQLLGRCLLTPHGFRESMSGARGRRANSNRRGCTVQRVDSRPRVHVPYAPLSRCSRAALARGVSAALRIL